MANKNYDFSSVSFTGNRTDLTSDDSSSMFDFDDNVDDGKEVFTPSQIPKTDDVDDSDGESKFSPKKLIPYAATFIAALALGFVLCMVTSPSADQPAEMADTEQVEQAESENRNDALSASMRDSEIELLKRQLSSLTLDEELKDIGVNDTFIMSDLGNISTNVISPFLTRLVKDKHDASTKTLEATRNELLKYCDYNTIVSSGDLDYLLLSHGVEGSLKSEVSIVGSPIVSPLYYVEQLNDKGELEGVTRAFLALLPVMSSEDGSVSLGIYYFEINSSSSVTRVTYLGLATNALDNTIEELTHVISGQVKESVTSVKPTESTSDTQTQSGNETPTLRDLSELESKMKVTTDTTDDTAADAADDAAVDSTDGNTVSGTTDDAADAAADDAESLPTLEVDSSTQPEN